MMEHMDNVSLLIVVLLAVAVAGAIGFLLARHVFAAAAPVEPAVPIDETVHSAVAHAIAEIREQAVAERDAAVQAALSQSAVMQREQLGAASEQARTESAAELGAKKDLIDSRLDQVQGEMRSELAKIMSTVNQFAEQSAQKFGQVDQSLRSHAEITQSLSVSAQALKEAMASPTARGQWGERMAEDVLRIAGLVENVNYVKQTQLEGATGRPDFTFPLPKGQELYMDVKFPMAAYLRFLEANTDAERQAHRAEFLRDVKLRIKELAKRDYARSSDHASLDYVLLFLPNEQLTGFIYETDPHIIDNAMQQKVVLCSPMTLFAFLGIIRQANDNFMIEQTSNEILSLIGKFGTEFDKYGDSLDKLNRKFSQLQTEFDKVNGVRRRQLEKPLRQLEQLRVERGVAIDGELFADVTAADADQTPENIRRLGA